MPQRTPHEDLTIRNEDNNELEINYRIHPDNVCKSIDALFKSRALAALVRIFNRRKIRENKNWQPVEVDDVINNYQLAEEVYQLWQTVNIEGQAGTVGELQNLIHEALNDIREQDPSRLITGKELADRFKALGIPDFAKHVDAHQNFYAQSGYHDIVGELRGHMPSFTLPRITEGQMSQLEEGMSAGIINRIFIDDPSLTPSEALELFQSKNGDDPTILSQTRALKVGPFTHQRDISAAIRLAQSQPEIGRIRLIGLNTNLDQQVKALTDKRNRKTIEASGWTLMDSGTYARLVMHRSRTPKGQSTPPDLFDTYQDGSSRKPVTTITNNYFADGTRLAISHRRIPGSQTDFPTTQFKFQKVLNQPNIELIQQAGPQVVRPVYIIQ